MDDLVYLGQPGSDLHGEYGDRHQHAGGTHEHMDEHAGTARAYTNQDQYTCAIHEYTNQN
jgi:hypothetical protein